MKRERPGPGQESVWDYPRPPRVEPEPRIVRIVLGGDTIATTDRALRVLETSHPPGIYVPSGAFTAGAISPNPQRTVCEWKGLAEYWDLSAGDLTQVAAAWSYPEPRPGLRSDRGIPLCVSGTRRRVLSRRRVGACAGRQLLRRLDHLRDRRSVQRSTRDYGLVTTPVPCGATLSKWTVAPTPVSGAPRSFLSRAQRRGRRRRRSRSACS